MKTTPRPTALPLALCLLVATALGAGAAPAAAGGLEVAAPAGAGDALTLRVSNALTLRVSDAVAPPGGLAAVVLRTYSSRPVGQGQLDVIGNCRGLAPRADSGPAFELKRQTPSLMCFSGGDAGLGAHLVGHAVFSSNGDVQSMTETPAEDPEGLRLLFVSPSVSVNDLDGPLAVLFFKLPPDVAPGTAIDVALDAADTLLVDGDGNPVPIEIEPGVLTVRSPTAPRRLSADGDRVGPGQTAELGIETFEPFALDAGRVVLHYDPAIAAGPPAVRFDRRYGRASFTADVSTPGTIVIDFQSVEGSLNRIPGAFIEIALPVSPAAVPGTRSPIELDRERTWLQPFGFDGVLPLRLEDDEIEID